MGVAGRPAAAGNARSFSRVSPGWSPGHVPWPWANGCRWTSSREPLPTADRNRSGPSWNNRRKRKWRSWPSSIRRKGLSETEARSNLANTPPQPRRKWALGHAWVREELGIDPKRLSVGRPGRPRIHILRALRVGGDLPGRAILFFSAGLAAIRREPCAIGGWRSLPSRRGRPPVHGDVTCCSRPPGSLGSAMPRRSSP